MPASCGHVFGHLLTAGSKLSPGDAGIMVVHDFHHKSLCKPPPTLPEIYGTSHGFLFLGALWSSIGEARNMRAVAGPSL